MKLISAQIENFKVLKKIILKDLSTINVIIGKNNSGKSSILEALILGFKSISKAGRIQLNQNQRYLKDNSNPVFIHLRFTISKDELASIRQSTPQGVILPNEVKLNKNKGTNLDVGIRFLENDSNAKVDLVLGEVPLVGNHVWLKPIFDLLKPYSRSIHLTAQDVVGAVDDTGLDAKTVERMIVQGEKFNSRQLKRALVNLRSDVDRGAYEKE